MEKSDVIEFFAGLASKWDTEYTAKNEDVINTILDNAEVGAGMDVLDVACGTGIMIPYYLERNAATVIAIDITPEMVEIAKEKFPQKQVRIICGDAADTNYGQMFDRIVVYNAFPHFAEPEKLISRLSFLLRKGGVLTVAHGMSREKINAVHHSDSAKKVSNGLMEAEELAEIFSRYTTVTRVISNDMMYQVAGKVEYYR